MSLLLHCCFSSFAPTCDAADTESDAAGDTDTDASNA